MNQILRKHFLFLISIYFLYLKFLLDKTKNFFTYKKTLPKNLIWFSPLSFWLELVIFVSWWVRNRDDWGRTVKFCRPVTCLLKPRKNSPKPLNLPNHSLCLAFCCTHWLWQWILLARCHWSWIPAPGSCKKYLITKALNKQQNIIKYFPS